MPLFFARLQLVFTSLHFPQLIEINFFSRQVHGGTSHKDIESKVKKAEELAEINNRMDVDTVLFFDEANTTDAIDLIKEIMVDRRVNGRPICTNRRLHFIAACNPYRK